MNFGDQPNRFPEYRPPTYPLSSPVPQNYAPFHYRPPNPPPFSAVPPPPLPTPPGPRQYSPCPAPSTLTPDRGKEIVQNCGVSQSSNVGNQPAYFPAQNLVPDTRAVFSSSGNSQQPKVNDVPVATYNINATNTNSTPFAFPLQSNVVLPPFNRPPPPFGRPPPPFIRAPSSSFPQIPPPPPSFSIPPPGFSQRFSALSEPGNAVAKSRHYPEISSSSVTVQPLNTRQSYLSGSAVSSSIDPSQQNFQQLESCDKGFGQKLVSEKPEQTLSNLADSWNAASADISNRENSSISMNYTNAVSEAANLSRLESELDPFAVVSSTQLRDDSTWVEQWSQSKRSESKSKRLSWPKTLSLTSFRKLLIEAVKLNDELKAIVCAQRNEVDLPEDICDQSEGDRACSPGGCCQNVRRNVADAEVKDNTSSLSAIQKRLIEIKDIITDELVSGMKRKLRKIENKRKRLKRKRLNEFEERQESLAVRAQIDQEIDNWQIGILWEQTKLKKDKEIQAAADETLFEVRRKLTEARRCRSLLDNIRKLRNLRKDKASRKGMLLDTDPDVAFEERIKAQMDILKRRINMYELEERTLEVMLETEQEANVEREMKIQKKKDEEKMQKFSKQLYAWLFGKDEPLSPSDPLFPYRQYYDIGSNNLAAFIRIRQEWDMYAVPYGTPGGSIIPFGWVKPVQPSSEIWASALKD